MILSEPRITNLPARLRSKKRQELLTYTLNAFSLAFPDVTYCLDAGDTRINAQAVTYDGIQYVYLFGGFAFHPEAKTQLLSFVMLHETGHHLAKGCRLPWDPRLACECEADRWAIANGLTVLQSRMRIALGETAMVPQMERLDELTRSGLPYRASEDCSGCWAFEKAKARFKLASSPNNDRSKCPLSAIVMGI
jgi:hypothetical protein